MLGFQTALAQIGSDKGLANYDDKDNAVDGTVYNIPILGPTLYPSASQCPL
jgi:hypothetical protein